MCKMQWSHHTKEGATWEGEEELKAEFPGFFSDLSESWDEIHYKGGRFFNTPILTRLKPLENFCKNK
jgi:hypothetical protein